jgi:hypothetical protein
MTSIRRPAVPMRPFELHWASGGKTGRLMIWAPDAETARQTVLAHPALFGLYENPIDVRPHPPGLDLC